MISQDQINNIPKILLSKFKVNKIFLFGSYVNNTNNINSDIDLCVVTDLQNKRKIEIIRELRKILYSHISAPLDILVYDEKEFNQRSKIPNTLEYEILNNGRILNG